MHVFRWQGSQWIPSGNPLLNSAGDYAGPSVSMPDEATVAVGAPGVYTTLERVSYFGTLTDRSCIYHWDGTAWLQQGNNISGEGASDCFGAAVDMPNPQTLAAGAPYNDGGGYDAGHVRVYQIAAWTSSSL